MTLLHKIVFGCLAAATLADAAPAQAGECHYYWYHHCHHHHRHHHSW